MELEKKGIKMIKSELKNRNNFLFEKLVPLVGKADTIEGEMLRAINLIIYRFSKYLDYFYDGFGAEIAGPASAYLIDESPLKKELKPLFYDSHYACLQADEYEEYLNKILEVIICYVESKKENYESNTKNFFDCKSHWENRLLKFGEFFYPSDEFKKEYLDKTKNKNGDVELDVFFGLTDEERQKHLNMEVGE